MVARYGEFPTFPCLRAFLQNQREATFLSLLLLLLLLLLMMMMISLVCF